VGAVARIGLVGSSGSDRGERNPASSMYLHDMMDEMSQMDELNGNPFELHWICERWGQATGSAQPLKTTPKNIIMEPTWTSRNFVFAIPLKLRKLRVNLVHIHHEPFLFGYSIFHSIAFILMLCLIRLLTPKARIILIMACIHAGKMPKDMARQSPLPASITDIGFHTLYRIAPRIAHAIMVAKQDQKRILVQHYGAKDDAVYAVLSYTRAHPLDLTRDRAREVLGLPQDAYVILNFGCLSYYKGLEQLLPAFYQELQVDKNAVLVVAGGPHPRLSYDKKYHGFESGLKAYAKEHDSPAKRAIFTGWVPGEMVPVYFAAADVAVAPYTCHIASSAVLFDAISYEVPIVMTKPILEHPLLQNEATMVEYPHPHLLASRIAQILTDAQFRQKNLEVVRQVKQDRLIAKTARQMVDMYMAELGKTLAHSARQSN
jgi:glycosyltransferase involved in cell wall biosynthesis